MVLISLLENNALIKAAPLEKHDSCIAFYAFLSLCGVKLKINIPLQIDLFGLSKADSCFSVHYHLLVFCSILIKVFFFSWLFFMTVILVVQVHGWAKCYVLVSVCTCTHTKCFTEIKGWVSNQAKEWNQPHNHNLEITKPLSELKMKVTQARITWKTPLTCLIPPHSVQQYRILASLWIFFLAIAAILLLLP